jgi:hypothetical protein
MHINIEFMASLRRPKDLDRIAKIEVPDDLTLKQVLKNLGYSFNEIRILQAFRSDGSRLTLKDTLNDGEKVFLTIPVGGG